MFCKNCGKILIDTAKSCNYYRKKNMIVLPEQNTGREVNWTATSCCPSDAQITQYLSNGTYQVFRGNYGYMAPGLFEYQVLLNRMSEKKRYFRLLIL